MTTRVPFMLLLALVLTGCANLILPWSNRIWEERTASPAAVHRFLVMSERLDWFASESGDRYEIWLPQGAYHVEAEDSDYLYYKAPERISLDKTKFFPAQDSRTYDGGIFISKSASSKYSSGTYIDYEGGKKLLLFYFDFRFTGQEGKRWHYVDAIGAEPTRDGGLSVHMLPDRVANLRGGYGGFTVTDPATKKPGNTYATPKELLTYFQQLPTAVQQNGIWVVTTHPDSYSDTEQAKLKELIALCAGKDIPIYTCRASELPDGWKRAK